MVKVAPSSGIGFQELYKRLQVETPTRLDPVVHTDTHVALHHEQGQGVQMMFMTPEIPELDGRVARITDYMHGQLAARSGIDKRYYDRMRMFQPDLLIKNVETWWHAEPEKRTVRTIEPATANAKGVITRGALTGRAWLSDRYRALDNLAFITTVLEEAEKFKADIVSCHLDDERVYMKLVSKKLKAEITKGDVVQAGIIVRNSEVGDGRVVVQPYALRLVCTNGLIRPENFGQVHLGGEKDIGILQQDTLDAEAASVWLQVRDWVRATFSGEFLQRTIDDMREAQDIRVPKDARLAVANVIRNAGLTGTDGAGVLERYLRANDETMFGMVNAVTQYAHQGISDYRRQVDVESYAGRLLGSDEQKFNHIVSAPLHEDQIIKAINPN